MKYAKSMGYTLLTASLLALISAQALAARSTNERINATGSKTRYDNSSKEKTHKRVKRIVRGMEYKEGFGWKIQIRMLYPRRQLKHTNQEVICGGSLISPTKVLTVAHCMHFHVVVRSMAEAEKLHENREKLMSYCKDVEHNAPLPRWWFMARAYSMAAPIERIPATSNIYRTKDGKRIKNYRLVTCPVQDLRRLKFVTGRYEGFRQPLAPGMHFQVLRASRVDFPKKYNDFPYGYPRPVHNDIAMVTLEAAAELEEDKVATVNLPTRPVSFGEKPICYAGGWGKELYTGRRIQFSHGFKIVEQRIRPDSEGDGAVFEDQDFNQGIAPGDSGGGCVAFEGPNKDKPVILGVNSGFYQPKGRDAGPVSFFVNVYAMRKHVEDWLDGEKLEEADRHKVEYWYPD